MENRRGTISISMEELTELMTIADAGKRREALDAIGRCVENPEAHVRETDCGAVKSVAERLRKSAGRRARAAARRIAAKKKAAEPKRETAEPKNEIREYDMPMNDMTARRLLWLKQHYGEWVDHVTRILRLFQGWEIGEQMAESVKSMTDVVQIYLEPLLDFARNYMKLPRHSRPKMLKVPLPVMG